jgi:hypothetical protein
MGCRKPISWMCCVPIPKPHDYLEGTPTFFIDRDLGRKAFPEGLRRAGLRVVTLAMYQPLRMWARMLRNLPAILSACRRPGPFVYRVHPDRIERLPLE